MKRILTNKEYRFIKGLKELMTKYNAVISTPTQGGKLHSKKIKNIIFFQQTQRNITTQT